jgi:hypothetical protein
MTAAASQVKSADGSRPIELGQLAAQICQIVMSDGEEWTRVLCMARPRSPAFPPSLPADHSSKGRVGSRHGRMRGTIIYDFPHLIRRVRPT